MKKSILLLTLLGLSPHSLSAQSSSWTGMYMKLLPAYSNLKLNYSGDTPYTMNLRKKPTFDTYHSRYNDGYSTHKIAEKVSANTMTVDFSLGMSQEVSANFGIIGEINILIGKSSNFIDTNDAILFNTSVTAGLFYHQPSFRVHVMGGFGIGEDIFGYPKAITNLQEGRVAIVNGNKSFVNSTIGFTYRGSIGFDYKITSNLLVGLSYIYTRSMSSVTLQDTDKEGIGENCYISNHSFAGMIGVQM
ncbi:MAG: outer membrane beta-barrel protein [Alphaproteobacteria bacterium]|nr:outer membrane beta-barrel protein [Alphaproteobacteria bacterium]